MLKIGGVKRLSALTFFIVLSVIRVSAAMSLSSDVKMACPGEAIVLDAGGTTSGHYLAYKWSLDQVTWYDCQSHTVARRIATDMTDNPSANGVYYKVVDVTDASNSSPVIFVEKDKSDACAKTCHITSTGDYFSGTDFDPERGVNSKSPQIPEQIVDFFDENDITFTHTDKSAYTITNDLRNFFNDQEPALDEGKRNNYYYVYDENTKGSTPFFYRFLCSTYAGKNYRYTMRFYVMKTQYNCGGSAAIKLETGHGNQTTDRGSIVIIDDATGDTIGKPEINTTFGQTNLGLGSAPVGKLLRIEVNYYGYFPVDKYDPNTGKYNGLEYFTLDPYFQQFDGCFKVAIDYISAEIESVCMEKGSTCVGQTTTINAAGFPQDAIYHWQYRDSNGQWQTVVVGGIPQRGNQFTRLSVPVKTIGKSYYRVVDDNPNNKKFNNLTKQNEQVVIEFTVTGKDCNPTPIDTILGDSVICAPTVGGGVKMTVVPVDVNENVSYVWTLYDPQHNKITDKSIVYQEVSDTRGTHVFLRMPETSLEGVYELQVFMTKKGDEGVAVPVGDIKTKRIHVYRTPKAHFTVDGFSGTGKDSICPSDNHREIYAYDNTQINNKYKYIYTWRNANGVTTDGRTALISWSNAVHDSLCLGIKNKHQIWETVEIAGVGCKATWDTILSVKKPDGPTIDCSSLGSSKQEVELGPTQKTTTITLNVPKVEGTCDPYPTVYIVGAGYDAKGNDLSFQIVARLDSLQKGLVPAMKRTVPATAGKKDNNGLVVTYYVVDGCNKMSSTCMVTYIIRDVTGPDVNCNDPQLKPLETRLSYFNVNVNDGLDTCEAYPGKGIRPDLLPVMSAPTLLDQNGVDGYITGEFVGRLDMQSSAPAMSEALFSKSKIALNDPVPAGYTYILWRFSDAVGNASYCMRKITVIDDSKPTVECPDAEIKEISVQRNTDECGLSLDSLIAAMDPADFPMAYEICPTKLKISSVRYFYRYIGRAPTSGDPNSGTYNYSGGWTEITDKQQLVFALGNVYQVAWRFYKQGSGQTVDHSVYAECIRTFSIVDKVPPVIDCSVLSDTAVTVNLNSQGDDLTYASATDTPMRNYITYTLKGFFKKIPTAVDACSGVINPVISVITPDGNTTAIGKQNDGLAKLLNELQKFHFPVGMSTVLYVYTDKAGNESTCQQNIIVYERIAMNCKDELVLKADENCVGHLDVTAATVETAMVSYVRQYKYKMYTSFTGLTYEPVTQDKSETNMFGIITKYGFDDCQTLQDSMKGGLSNRMVSVYPYQVKKVTYVDDKGGETDSSTVVVLKNTSELEELDWKLVQHQFYSGAGPVGPVGPGMGGPGFGPGMGGPGFGPGVGPGQKPTSIIDQVYKTISLQTKTFAKEFTADFKTFAKGRHKIVWYYDNGQGDQDSCVVIVSVVDSTAPTVECGEWGKDIVTKSDSLTCQAVVKLTQPTAKQLNASDNCTDVDNLVISFSRVWKNKKYTSLDDPYEQGTTVVTWIIADEAGNEAYCVQNITVNDSTGPNIDCDKILVNPISVDADESCLAKKDVLVDAGLKIPVVDPSADLCSPSAEPIRGVGHREDVNGVVSPLDVMNDPYSLGQTYVVWTFSDTSNNTTVCRQLIIVNDKTAPDVDCSVFEDNPLEYVLASDQCSAPLSEIKVLLGRHVAKDNCDKDSVVGVPYMLLKNGTSRVALPSVFVKDTTYTIIWVFTDEAGNEATCNQLLSVVDTTAPDNSICPDPVKVIDADVKCTFTYDELNIPNLSVNDLCDGVLVGKLTGEIQQPNGKTVYPSSMEEFQDLEYYAGTVNKFKWTFTDHAGLTSTCEMTLTINDSIPPVINNCETGNDAVYEMSNGVCYAKWADLSKLIVIPNAFDECQELIDGTGSSPIDPLEIRRYFNGELVAVSTGDDKAWCADPFPRGLTRLVWVFSDRSGNVDSCAKTLKVIARTDPSFICDSIQPNPMRPKALEGECYIEFNDLEFGTYYGFDACSNDSIKAKLLMAPVPEAIPVPKDLKFNVGDTITVYWVVVDEDKNYAYCPQVVIPSHSNKINFDCSTLDSIKSVALEGECYIPAEDLNLPHPFAIDSCALANGANDTIYGVPTRSDSLKYTDNYPTGKTSITWTFVSPFNIDDTVICHQVVVVDGNKHFDLDCDVVSPQINDTVPDCGPDPNIVLVYPQVPDPCVEDTVITGVPVARTDGKAIDADFPLGPTIITWTFTDATGAITDTCRQKVLVLTEKDLIKPCDTAAMETLLVAAPEDACTVPAADVPLERPYALHPCTFDTVWAVLSRPGISDLNAPYNIGLNRLVWTFTDTTNTLVNPVGICEQFVKVGDVEVEPVDCKNMPDISKVLKEGDCLIDFADFELNVPPVIDRCPNGDPNGEPVEIKPLITRASKKGWSTTEVSEIGTFGVGRDTIFWLYTIAGNEFLCEQHISVKDSVEPVFDCSKLGLVLAEAEDGQCEVPLDAVLKLLQPYPVAVETCTGDSIEGVPSLEDGSDLPATFKVGDTVVVKWTFIDTLVNAKAKICRQPVTVISNAEPIFDCNSLDTLLYVAHGACSIVLTEDSIPIPVAKDSCTGTDVPGVASRADGGSVYGTYSTGFVTLTWTFDSPYSKKNKVCSQVIHVVTDLEIDAQCGEENYPTIKVAVEDGVCEVDPAQILEKIHEHTAVNPCHNTWIIKGVPTRSDGKALDDNYPIGLTIITWTFTDTTKTLLNPVSTCDQRVEVGDNNEPPVDCEKSFPAVTRYLDAENCFIEFAEIPVFLDSMPVNKCNGDVAVLDTTRESGKSMSEPFEVGKDVIIWKFTFPSNNQTMVCYQNVEVIDTVAPPFECSVLTPVINVAFKVADVNYVTYDEVKDAGFYIPVVTDSCCEVKTTVTRSDNLKLEDNYPYGETVVTFVFSDDHGNDNVCSQIIKVSDMIPPKEVCPKVGGTYACLTDVPAEMSYNEFVAAGGYLDDPSRADLSTFKAVTEVVGDSCEAMVIRDYHLLSIRQDLVTCSNGPDTFYVKDNVAPTYVGISPVGESVNVACFDVNYELPNVGAEDNCDPNPIVTMNFTSTQGLDPSKCDYYTYDLIYSWTAVDRCGNTAEPVTFTVHVKDSIPPIVNPPANWGDALHPLYLKNCRFGVPDITGLIPLDSVIMPCGGLEYLEITQSPAAGTEITESIYVTLEFKDVCGKKTTLQKFVSVQQKDDIVKIIREDTAVVCGGDETLADVYGSPNTLSNASICSGYGITWVIDWDGSWVDVTTTVLWDYYRDEIDESKLLYSNNPATYESRFKPITPPFQATEEQKLAAQQAYIDYLMLLRKSQSGDYWFVAMDTVSGCTDTAKVYIDVRERPRVNLASGLWKMCDGDSLTLNGDFGSSFSVCVDEMGSPILSEGWLVNDSIYVPNTPIVYDDGASHMLAYYATNQCGTTTSLSSLYTPCGSPLLTHEDSLKVFGSEENVKLAKEDKYYASDSVKVDVFTHYDPAQVLLTTKPQNKARIWRGESADLILTLPYQPATISWRRVEGLFDGTTGAVYNRNGEVVYNTVGENDDVDLFVELWNNRDTTIPDSVFLKEHERQNLYVYTVEPTDSSRYYVVVSNDVCPAVASNMVSLDVLNEIPTAITPYTKDGMNDDFMRGHHVIIFNRYGQMIFEGNDGWDGTYRGVLVDPGVYYYNCDIQSNVFKGSIEVVKIE